MKVYLSVETDETIGFSMLESWARGYKTFFMLNSTEHEIFHVNKSQIVNIVSLSSAE